MLARGFFWLRRYSFCWWGNVPIYNDLLSFSFHRMEVEQMQFFCLDLFINMCWIWRQWKKSTMYKRNISNASSSASATRNKYSGNYGIRSQNNAPKDPYKGRGYSLDRSRAGSRQTSPTRKLSTGNMTRTRSQVILGNQGGMMGNGNSSGDDSYGSSSRPPSSGYRDWLSGSTPMYSSR